MDPNSRSFQSSQGGRILREAQQAQQDRQRQQAQYGEMGDFLGIVGGAGFSSPQASSPRTTSHSPSGGQPSTQTTPVYQGGGGATGPDLGALRTQFGQQQSTILDSAGDRIGTIGRNARNSILDLVDSLTSRQRGIDESSIENELSRRYGSQGVQDMVGRGIQSGGNILANRNALASSAAGAIARAYGALGQRELSGVNQQAQAGERQIGMEQSDLNRARAGGVRDIEDDISNRVDGLVFEVQDKLSALQGLMAGASLPDRIEIQQEASRVRQQALKELAQYDSMLSQRTSGITPLGRGGVISQAGERFAQGVAPDNSFNFDTAAPGEFQGSGPFSGNLPVFARPRGDEEEV